MSVKEFEAQLVSRERRLFAKLTTPAKVQAFLDAIPYSAEERYRCPLTVLRDRQAHCFDGALFDAAALRRLGHPPRIVDLLPGDDDDHLLAIYKRDGRFGAVAKSNFAGLRFREPVYRSLRELVMSYFEQYYNLKGQKTLRGYTLPLNLKAFDKLNWMLSDENLEVIADRLGEMRQVRVLTPQMVRRLSPMDKLSYQAGMLGTDPKGLYRPTE
ncbi:MAG: hypothetical protein ACRDH2_14085 [Anaerolineales bacterium]